MTKREYFKFLRVLRHEGIRFSPELNFFDRVDIRDPFQYKWAEHMNKLVAEASELVNLEDFITKNQIPCTHGTDTR